jgi:hypothetical protein
VDCSPDSASSSSPALRHDAATPHDRSLKHDGSPGTPTGGAPEHRLPLPVAVPIASQDTQDSGPVPKFVPEHRLPLPVVAVPIASQDTQDSGPVPKFVPWEISTAPSCRIALCTVARCSDRSTKVEETKTECDIDTSNSADSSDAERNRPCQGSARRDMALRTAPSPAPHPSIRHSPPSCLRPRILTHALTAGRRP